MLVKKDEYVRVAAESLARVRVTGKIIPVRKQRRVARMEDVAFLAEAAAERRGKDAGSVTVGMTRFGTALETYADLAEGHLDAAKLAEANLDFEDWCERKNYGQADIDKAKAARDAAEEMAKAALDAALNKANAKYQKASADANKAAEKAEKTLANARSEFERAKSDAARRRRAEVEAIDDATMDAAEILAATLSAYGGELAEVEEARRSLGKAEAEHRRAMNEADAAKRTAAAELEAAQAAARTAEAEAVSAADAAYRDALKEYGAADPDVLSEVDAAIATLAPYDAISAYGGGRLLRFSLVAGVGGSWVSAELVERAFAVADAATVRNLGEHAASRLVVGVETRKENSSSSSGGGRPQPSSSTSTSVGSYLGYRHTTVSSGSSTNKDTGTSQSYSLRIDVTYSLKHALLAVNVGGRHDAVKAVRGVVVVSASGETGRAEKSAMVEFSKAKSSSRYAKLYEAVDALDDEIAAGQKKRDALAAVVKAAAKKDYDAALAALDAERDEAVAEARAKADAEIAGLRAAYAEAVMEPLFAWNATTDTAAKGTADAEIASLGETLAGDVAKVEAAYKEAVAKADDDLKTLRGKEEPGIKATYDEAVAAGLEPIDAEWNAVKAVLDERREKAYREGVAAAEDRRADLNAERSAALANLKEVNESADTTAVEIHYAKELFDVPDFDLSARGRWECDVSSLSAFGSSLYSRSSTKSEDGDTSVTNSFSSEVRLARLFVEYGYRATTGGKTRDFETLDA